MSKSAPLTGPLGITNECTRWQSRRTDALSGVSRTAWLRFQLGDTFAASATISVSTSKAVPHRSAGPRKVIIRGTGTPRRKFLHVYLLRDQWGLGREATVRSSRASCRRGRLHGPDRIRLNGLSGKLVRGGLPRGIEKAKHVAAQAIGGPFRQ
jgi:hypothetical protein